MGVLDKLWDNLTFSFRSNSGKDAAAAAEEEEPRSIVVRRSAGENGTPPLSPAESSTPPVSFFSGGGGKEWNRFRRKSLSDAHERPAGMVGVEPRSPPPYEV